MSRWALLQIQRPLGTKKAETCNMGHVHPVDDYEKKWVICELPGDAFGLEAAYAMARVAFPREEGWETVFGNTSTVVKLP